jgi:ribosomal 50S subunit-associated protein YjgA (DUF615 family)
MTRTLPEMIDNYANALAEYRLAKAEGADKRQIVYLKRKMRLNGWYLVDLGLNVKFDDTDD